jgi:hypothetical protein
MEKMHVRKRGLLYTLTNLAGFSTDFRIVNYNRSQNRKADLSACSDQRERKGVKSIEILSSDYFRQTINNLCSDFRSRTSDPFADPFNRQRSDLADLHPRPLWQLDGLQFQC